MAKASYPIQQKPAPTNTLHKRRPEDEMRQALAAFVANKPRLRNDERDAILEDAITELLAIRRVLMQMSQGMALLQADMTTGIEQIF